MNELPNNGAHIPVVQEAEALMRRIEMEQKAYALLDEAMGRRDLNALSNALAGCDRMVPPLKHAKVEKARQMKVGDGNLKRGGRGGGGGTVDITHVVFLYTVSLSGPCGRGGGADSARGQVREGGGGTVDNAHVVLLYTWYMRKPLGTLRWAGDGGAGLLAHLATVFFFGGGERGLILHVSCADVYLNRASSEWVLI